MPCLHLTFFAIVGRMVPNCRIFPFSGEIRLGLRRSSPITRTRLSNLRRGQQVSLTQRCFLGFCPFYVSEIFVWPEANEISRTSLLIGEPSRPSATMERIKRGCIDIASLGRIPGQSLLNCPAILFPKKCGNPVAATKKNALKNTRVRALRGQRRRRCHDRTGLPPGFKRGEERVRLQGAGQRTSSVRSGKRQKVEPERSPAEISGPAPGDRQNMTGHEVPRR